MTDESLAADPACDNLHVPVPSLAAVAQSARTVRPAPPAPGRAAFAFVFVTVAIDDMLAIGALVVSWRQTRHMGGSMARASIAQEG